ncbi:hypothetical protein TNCV_1372991 [Trichonephila clavipes]|uniref:Uncharacterized protein n=1 Tax=Trichonephila clavipes TaxID=2585209 RepID=A0A8X7BKK4_TRICX|nr:hypothetical protein TNCV_1372991 [Trichonephila clavipes]
MSSRLLTLKTGLAEGANVCKYVEAQTSSRWCDVKSLNAYVVANVPPDRQRPDRSPRNSSWVYKKEKSDSLTDHDISGSIRPSGLELAKPILFLE